MSIRLASALLRIGFAAARFEGTDGVSLASEKWAEFVIDGLYILAGMAPDSPMTQSARTARVQMRRPLRPIAVAVALVAFA